MKKNNFISNVRKFILGASAVGMLAAFSVSGNAQTIEETESNDTIETAQTIKANNESATTAANQSYTGQYVVDGYTSTSDPDWYKVYLSSGTKYITCNGCSLNWELYDSNGNYLFDDDYTYTGSGAKAFGFTVNTADYFYVKITGVSASSRNYKLLVGSPTYKTGSYTQSMSKVTMKAADGESKVNLSNISSIPNDAIACAFRINNVASNKIKSATVSVSGKSFSLFSTNLSKSGIASSKIKAKSLWVATFKYKTNCTLTPKITVTYVYPLTN